MSQILDVATRNAPYSIDFVQGWAAQHYSWVLVFGFITSFFLSFGMGANDCANSYGTVVGAGVLTLSQVYAIATFTETSGAALLGYRVTDTMRTSIVDLSMYDIFAIDDSNNKTSYLLNSTCGGPSPVPEPRDCCGIWANMTMDSNPNLVCQRYTEPSLMLGELGALAGTAAWLLIATVFKMPVSTTQSSVGAIIGFSLVLKGSRGIQWGTVGWICASWVFSPLMTGALGTFFFILIKAVLLSKEDSFAASVRALPVIVFLCFAINGFTVFYKGSKYLHFDVLTWWESALISSGIGLAAALSIYFFATERIRKRAIEMYERDLEKGDEPPTVLQSPMILLGRKLICPFRPLDILEDPAEPKTEEEMQEVWATRKASAAAKGHRTRSETVRSFVAAGKETLWGYISSLWEPQREEGRTVKVFHFLQVISACFLSFSHGSNDTANSVSALAALWVAYTYGTADYGVDDNWRLEMIIVYGAFSMVIGLWVLGHKVIQTVGKDITELNAPVGFAIEMATAFTILLGSLKKMPLSTTHCMVGGVMIVGWVRTRQPLQWRLLSGIAFAWLVTIPVAGGVSAILTYLLGHFYLGVI